MTENVARSVSVPPPIPDAAITAKPSPPPPTPRNDNNDASRYRLTIESLGDNRFVYKVLDRVTGEVVRQLPREDVETLSSDPTYRGGRLVDTAV